MTTPRLGLLEIAAAQAQKHVTHNVALRRLDMLVQAVVLAKQSAPPGSPVAGDMYLIGASPTGAWSGKANNLAMYIDGGWLFLAPPDEGIAVFNIANQQTYRYIGAAWVLQRYWRTLFLNTEAAAAHTGTTSETAIDTLAIPANTMGIKGILRVTQAWSYTASVNNRHMRTRFGASGTGGTQFQIQQHTTATATDRWQVDIWNTGVANAQKSALANTGGWTGTASALPTGTIDTTVAQNIVLTAHLGLAGESMTREMYEVSVNYGE